MTAAGYRRRCPCRPRIKLVGEHGGRHMNAANGASEASIAGRRAGLKVSRRPGACPTVKATFHKPWSDFRGRRPQIAYQNHQNRKKVLALQPQSNLESKCSCCPGATLEIGPISRSRKAKMCRAKMQKPHLKTWPRFFKLAVPAVIIPERMIGPRKKICRE